MAVADQPAGVVTRAPVPVRIDSWVIGDHGDPPRVGRVEQYILAFHEAATDDDGEPGVRTWDLVAAPKRDGRPQRVEAPDGTAVGDEWFDVVLHGDGWAAYWRSPRPVAAGPVRLRGFVFWGWTGPAWPETRLRGRVARIQVVSRTVDTSDADPQRWAVVPGGWALRDVEAAPWMFERGVPPGVARHPNPWTSETGVLVHVEPDDGSTVMPEAIAARGDVLWVADRDRPVVLRLEHPRDPRPVVTRFAWDAHDFCGRRRLHADATGCWVTDTTGVRRLEVTTAGPAVRLVDDAPVGGLALGALDTTAAAAGTDGTLAVIHPAHLGDLDLDERAEDRRDRLRRHSPGGRVEGADDVELPGLAREVRADADGFVVELTARAYRFPEGLRGPEVLVSGALPDRRAVRVGTTGTVRTGPPADRATGVLPVPGVAPFDGEPPAPPWRLHRVWGDEPALPDGRVLGRSGARLHLAAGRVFASAQIPTPEQAAQIGPVPWWPFPGPPDPDPAQGQFWFAELDPVALEPVRSVRLLWFPRHLGITADGTVWVQADLGQGGRVHHVPPDHPDGIPVPWLSITGGTA